MTMRKLTAIGATMGVLMLAAQHAQAQEKKNFGDRGEFILSADRLFPLIGWSRTSRNLMAGELRNGFVSGSTSTEQSSLSLFYGTAFPQEVFYTIPRVGFDYVVAQNVTIGGDLIFFTTLGGSDSNEQVRPDGSTQTTTTDRDQVLAFGIAPRGGYILRVSDLIAFWLRGGLSVYTLQDATPNNNGFYTHTNVTQFSLDLEPQFVITPAPHVGITFGVNGDIPLVGRYAVTTFNPGLQTTNSVGSSIWYVGVSGGLFIHF